MSLTDAERLLAEHCYGYGRWDAPYWFIGPEQGQSKDQKCDSLDARAAAFRALQIDGLCDCREFHLHMKCSRFFELNKRGVIPTQTTWRRLIRALLAYDRNNLAGVDIPLSLVRQYQAKEWGSRSGKTCVIDLSGLAANNMTIQRARGAFLEKRLTFIHGKMQADPPPKFAVIYGESQREHWLSFWKKQSCLTQYGEFYKVGTTMIAFQSTPKGQSDKVWIELGEKLRAA